MTAPVNKTPISVDYTSRDFYSLRNDLIARVQDRLRDDKGNPIWTGEDPADFGVALIEAFAYMGDVVNYYIDRIANEANISTATQRQSILNIAKTYGYFPTGYRAATVDVQFTNLGLDTITIPAGTQIYADVSVADTMQQVIYTTQSDLTLLTTESGTITCLQYEDISQRTENQYLDKAGERVGPSNGQPEQQYTLSENQVVDNSVKVFVKNGDVYEEWKHVTHLVDYGPSDLVFTTTTDANNFVCVTFGDGVSGYIPPKDSEIRIVYFVGGGTIGNVAMETPFQILKFPVGVSEAESNALLAAIDTANIKNPYASAMGGAEPEDNATIRQNAPKLLTSFNRAITLKDYANLALAVASVGKANSQSDLWSSVNLYIAPQTSNDPYPGYSTTDLDTDPLSEALLTPGWLTSKQDVIDYFADKTQIGVSVTVLPPNYTRITLSLQYTAIPGYSEEKVTANIKAALFSTYSYANLSFANVITPEEIEANLRFVDGVLSVRVISFNRLGSTGRVTLVGEADEIFTFENANVSVTMLSSVASLSNIASGAGTITPAFSSTFYNYNFTTSTSTTTLTITSASGGTIYADGAEQTSGSPFTVSTPTGTTTVPVIVTAADGIAKKTYTVTFTH